MRSPICWLDAKRSYVALAIVLAAAQPIAAHAQDTTGARLQELARNSTFTWARMHPIVATGLGLTDEDGLLDAPTPATRAHDIAVNQAWLRQVDAISLRGASLVDRDDAKLLRSGFVAQLRAFTVYRSDQTDYSTGAQAIVDILFTQFQHLPIAGSEGRTKADASRAWDQLIARMAKSPAYIVAMQRLAIAPGHLQGIVGSEALAGAPDFLRGPLTLAAKAQLDSRRYAAFVRARDPLVATILTTKRYIDTHVAHWPENFAMGRSAYNAMLRDEQLLPFTADDVERMGREEIATGWTQEAWYRSRARASHTSLGAASGGGMAPSGDALIAYYRARLAELKKFVVDRDVITVPSWLGDVQVVETPKFLQPTQPGAAMNEPRLFSPEKTGYYFITPPKSLVDAAKRLDLYEDFDRDRILSTAAHEAMPGHFLQGSIARRNPDFIRKIQGSSVFAEGWAYYGESMFVALGLYGEDLDGPLDVAQWERIRGARAVLDAKLATGDWNYARGVAFFAHSTGVTLDEARSAVSGIALGPGYVISYTVGRYQLEELLAEYLHRKGPAASLLEFHDRLMCYGTTPFAVVAPELLADLHKPLAQVRAAARY